MKTNLSSREVIDINSQQIFTLEKKLYKGEFSIESVGDYLPGNLLINDLNEIIPTYINKSGCNILKHSVDELKEQGPEYFKRFFVPEEVNVIIPNYISMLQKQDSAHIYNYVQRVQSVSDASYKWYFASAKLMYTPGQTISDKMILIVNEVNSLGLISKKINSVLEESDWMKKNFKKFCRLNKREKEIIPLLVSGKSSSEIADFFCISHLTVNTHRRNIGDKLEVKTFAGLYKFAVTFGLPTLKSYIIFFVLSF